MSQCAVAPRVLIADDQPDILDALRRLIRTAGFEAECATTVQGVRDRLAGGSYDLVLMDLNYARDTTSGREGLDLLAEIRSRDGALPVIVMTGWSSIDTAVEAMRLGARTFVEKPWDNATLAQTIRREIVEGRARRTAGMRTSRELEHARAIQRALLPDTLPRVRGAELAALWRPAGAVGGDCYDARRLDDTQLTLSIADVAGKGLPAALLMSHLQASTRALASRRATPRELVAQVNTLLCGNPGLETFVTFCHLRIDTAARTATFCNAGHNPPLLVRANGSVERLTDGGVVLGVLPDAGYEQAQLTLAAGDRLVLFTDGITEARRGDEEFGDARLVDAVVRRRRAPAGELLDAVFADVCAFTGGTLHDDATLLVLALD